MPGTKPHRLIVVVQDLPSSSTRKAVTVVYLSTDGLAPHPVRPGDRRVRHLAGALGRRLARHKQAPIVEIVP